MLKLIKIEKALKKGARELDLDVTKGRSVPGSSTQYYTICRSEHTKFTGGKLCSDCKKNTQRICRVIVPNGDEDYYTKDVCDICYMTKYKKKDHECENKCPTCNCREL